MKHLILFCLFLTINVLLPCQGQDPVHFTIGDRIFAGTEIYTLIYDDETQILYAGTNSGLYAYKQNKFIRLEGPNGQLGNDFFSLKKDSEGHIYCCNLNGQIFKINGNRFDIHYQAAIEDSAISFDFYFVENRKILTISPNNISLVDSLGSVENLNAQISQDIHSKIPINYYDSRQFFNGEVFISMPTNIDYMLVYSQGKFSKSSFRFYTNNTKLDFLEIKDYQFAIDLNGQLKYSNRPMNFQSNINSAETYKGINQEYVIATGVKKGLRFLEIEEDSLIEKHACFENQFISATSFNQNGTLFLGTFGEGIIIIPNKDVLQASYDHLFLGITSSPDNQVFLSTRGGEIFTYKNELELIDKNETNLDKVYYLKGNFEFQDLNHENLLYKSDLHGFGTMKDFHQINEELILVVMLGSIVLVADKSGHRPENLKFYSKLPLDRKYHLFPPQRYSSVTYSDSDSMFYFTSDMGLYRRHWSSEYIDTIFWEQKALPANDLVNYRDQLIVATANEGILFFKEKESVKQINVESGLNSSFVKKIACQNNRLFILSNQGVQIYNLVDKNFEDIGMVKGLKNGGITNFCLSNDKLWLLEKHRFYSIEIEQVKKNIELSKVFVDSILVNEKWIDPKFQHSFGHDENEIKIFFDYRNIETKNESVINYTLEGFYDDWRTVSASVNEIEFQSLPSGNYTFRMEAEYRSNTSEKYVYSFKILPPFWERWWFYLFLTIGGILTTAGIFAYLTRRQSKKLAVRNELNNSKLTAIKSQMNPHFIFNALNSIQHLVLKGDVDKSYSFITKFAKLIRKTLEYSELEFISLEDEIHLLEVYLSLEKLIFKDKFNYEIIKPENVKVSIPPMLIQPFIENAIVHGLLHKKGNKRLIIRFVIEDHLICLIEDNGVGRAHAKAIKERQKIKHKSFSSKAIEQKFTILKDYFDGDIGYTYEDLEPKDSDEFSTRVRLQIPVKSVRKE